MKEKNIKHRRIKEFKSNLMEKKELNKFLSVHKNFNLFNLCLDIVK